MCEQRALFFKALQAEVIWPEGQLPKQTPSVSKINTSVSLIAGAWKELLLFPTDQTSVQRAEAGLVLPEAFNSGLR